MLINPEYDLQRDEYLHLDQANHLAWGFESVPPFTSWNSYIIQLLGNSVFWIKFFPALYGALTLYVVWKAVEDLNGNLFALVLGATCVFFSALLRLNILYQPNSFDVLSWTTFYWMVLKYVKTQNTKWLFIGAVVFAIGFLNKYNIGFLLLGLTPALILSKHRKVFTEPKLYLAVLLALVIISPNLVWQYKNDFPVIGHLNELAATQLVNTDRVDFLKSQLLFFMGALPVILSGLYALLFYKPFQQYRYLLLSLFFTVIIFLYFKAKDYYAIGIYPIYIAFGSVYLMHVLKENWKRNLQPVFITIPILLFIPVYRVAFPNKSPEYIIQHGAKYKEFGLLRWEDGKDHLLPQDFADMLGWKELASKADRIFLAMPNKEKTLVLCDNYGQAGAINYYSKQNLKAVTFNADYINWFDLSINYENLIRVKEFEGKETEMAETAPYFKQATLADSITNPYAREYGTCLFVFVHSKFDIRERIRQEIEEVKKE